MTGATGKQSGPPLVTGVAVGVDVAVAVAAGVADDAVGFGVGVENGEAVGVGVCVGTGVGLVFGIADGDVAAVGGDVATGDVVAVVPGAGVGLEGTGDAVSDIPAGCGPVVVPAPPHAASESASSMAAIVLRGTARAFTLPRS